MEGLTDEERTKKDLGAQGATEGDTAGQAVPADQLSHDVTNGIADYLRMRVDRLSRIVPSEIDADEQMCRNGEYVSLFDVQQLIDGLRRS